MSGDWVDPAAAAARAHGIAQADEALRIYTAAAVLAEREACAKIAEQKDRENTGGDNAEGSGYSEACEDIAEAIRARK